MSYRKHDQQRSLSKRHLICFLEFLAAKGYTLTALDDYELLYKIELNGFVRYLSDLDFNSTACSRLLKDKVLTYLALDNLQINVPDGTYFLLGNHLYSQSSDEILESLRVFDYPIICKPNDSSLGKAVSVLPTFNEQRVTKAISKVREYSDILIVQQYLRGREYRVIAVEGEIILAFEKHDDPGHPTELSLTECKGFRDLVLNSMHYFGATVCGFDLMVKDGVTHVLEINSNPFVFPVKSYLNRSTMERYFSKLEGILRRRYGNKTSTSAGLRGV